MKVTKRQLRQIIKEERAKLLHEQAGAFLKQSTLEALHDALETAYFEATDAAVEDGYDKLEALEAAFAAVMEEVDGFADSVGFYTRTGSPM
jgi:methanogenic corrinoid protein MtbC1